MGDIAALPSLKPASQAVDPAVTQGLQAEESRAFGDILAGQVQAAGIDGASAGIGAFAAAVAGKRQAGGKILPGAAQILPDAAIIPVEAPSGQQSPHDAIRIAAEMPKGIWTKLTDQSHGKRSAADSLRGLARATAMSATARRQGEGTMQAAAQADPEAPAVAVLPTGIAFQLPSFSIPVAPLPQPVTDAAASATLANDSGQTSAVLTTVPAGTAREALAEPTNPLSPAVTQPQHQPGQQPAAPLSDAQVSVGREAPSPPVLAVPATPLDVPAPPVVLLPAQANPVARIATARVRIAPADGQENLPQSLDRPPPPRAAFADRALPVHVLPVTITMNPEAQPQATNSLPVSDPSPTQTVNAPRQDFTALVERLIEARDTSSAHSVHAAIAHADFGQVSLHFQQDGKDLTVGMSSADPEFAVAVRAAMPADRSGLAAEGRPQSQSHSQSQGQSQGLSTGGSSSQHDEAGGRGNGGTADSQTRSGQGRNLRANANPAPATADLGQPKHRNGIFA